MVQLSPAPRRSETLLTAVSTRGLTHRYGDRLALDSIDLEVSTGHVFALLGPNGGGKTTLFRLLTTYFLPQQGQATILGLDLRTERMAIRHRIGVVFQHPSLDAKLTVAENLKHHGRLYGMSRGEIRSRSAEMLARLGISDRGGDRVETLSGGLARRVELAKGMMHAPELLILDEPSTGLDPGARRDLWQYLSSLRDDGVTILVTTHLMDEAERSTEIGILDHGKLVALGTGAELRAEIGGDIVTIESRQPGELIETLQRQLGLQAVRMDNKLRVEVKEGYQIVPRLAEIGRDLIESIAVSKPTLEDVFIRRTGHRFWAEE